MKSIQRTQILYRAKIKLDRITPYLNRSESILDIGSGNGGLVFLLKEQGFQVTAVDIRDKCQFDQVPIHIYNGKDIPFSSGSFPLVSIITVLHHIADPEATLREAIRVSNDRILVMEDIYANTLQKKMTNLADSVVNWEFRKHPHSNKTDAEWKGLFDRLELNLDHVEFYRFAGIFKQVLYVLSKKKGMPE